MPSIQLVLDANERVIGLGSDVAEAARQAAIAKDAAEDLQQLLDITTAEPEAGTFLRDQFTEKHLLGFHREGNATVNGLRVVRDVNIAADEDGWYHIISTSDPLGILAVHVGNDENPGTGQIKIGSLSDDSISRIAARLGVAQTGGTIWCWGDSMTYGQGATTPATDSYPAVLASLSSRAVRNEGVPGETSTEIATRMLATTDAHGSLNILWVGRNDLGQRETIRDNVVAMAAAVREAGGQLLVMPPANGEDEGVGQANAFRHTYVTENEQTLEAVAGGDFIPLRRWAIDFGLEEAGITPTTQDDTDVAADTVPDSLRFDGVHWNTDAYAAAASFIYNCIQTRGY
tara:strand:+ start:4163 stop:5197 length:1035 start_codon:yes stop_codon:yes gene_type:complete